MKRNSMSLADYSPKLALQWHPTKNGKLTPQNTSPRSNKKAWWKCNDCGHEWQAVINNRIRSLKCPSCIGRTVTRNNCLAHRLPELALQWHPTKNGKLTPFDITLKNNQKIWWQCDDCGYEWLMSPLLRTQRGRITKCFNCNSLLVNAPNLAKEWHPTKNGKLTPQNVTHKSGLNVWWKCSGCGHDWMAKIRDRYIGEKSCLRCNCLSSQNPNLAKEWHPTKNRELMPHNITCGSKKNVWWKCSKCDYEWQAMVYKRNNGLKTCFKCNSLGEKSPELAKEWHPTKNGKLTPYDVSYGSNLNVWWKCQKCDGEWLARPQSRQDGNGCPCCQMIVLKDGTMCDSLTDAHFYLLFKQKNIVFMYNKRYKNLGRRRYDFYLPKENKYIEVTSFDKRGYEIKTGKSWQTYLDNIEAKRKYVESMGCKFEFIYKKLNKKEINYIRLNAR